MTKVNLIILKLFFIFWGLLLYGSATYRFFQTTTKGSISNTILYFGAALFIAITIYIVLSIIFFLLNKVNSRFEIAMSFGFQLLAFKSLKQFWTRWAQAIVFIPLIWVFFFAIFFGVNGPSAFVDLIEDWFYVIQYTPVVIMSFFTILNFTRYFTWRSHKTS